MEYYVYTHELNGEIIYCGKGTGNRAIDFWRRRKQWKKVVGDNKILIKVDIVQWFETEEDTYEYEKELTLYYKNIGQCRGNINIGKYHAEETKRLISEKGKGKNNSMYGKEFSDEHKRKLSEARKGERNHLFGKTGGEHNCAKSIVAIFPDGTKIEATSKVELSEILKDDYNVSPSMINNLIKSGEPLQARYKKHEKAKGLIVRYVEAS